MPVRIYGWLRKIQLNFITWKRKCLQSQNKNFYSHLNIGDITDADYLHAKRNYRYFEKWNSGDYHGLNAQSNPLFLGDVFENFSNACLKIYEFDPDHFLHQGYPGKQPLKMQK